MSSVQKALYVVSVFTIVILGTVLLVWSAFFRYG